MLKYKYIIALFVSALLSGCFAEEEFDYNYSSFVPRVQNMSGPSAAIANGFGESKYSVLTRGGSTYAWTVTGATATVTNDAPNIVTIVFAESAVPLTATVSVVETAANGNASDPAEISVELAAYCPLNTAVYVGTAATVSDSRSYTTGVTLVADGASGLILDGVMDAQVIGSWGETYDAGVGNEGSLKITLNADGTVVIPNQHFGTTENGAWEYWMRGSGTYDQCNKTLTLSYTFGGPDQDDYYTNVSLVIGMNAPGV